MKVGRLFTSVVGATLIATGALAADPPPMAASAFDWGGAYVGTYDRYNVTASYYERGFQAGYNLVLGRFLIGAEGRIGYLFAPTPSVGGFLYSRAGMLLGDRALIYAAAGVGTYRVVSVWYYQLDAGIELALGARVSALVEAGVIGVFGTGCCGTILRAGLNFHPGN